MGRKEQVNFRLHPGAVEVHQLHTHQQKVSVRLPLTQGGEFAGADLGSNDGARSVITEEAE
jgi:hypothetical protein